jgi:pyruvate-formate lyase-activating enzyme
MKAEVEGRKLFCSRPFTHLEVSTKPERGSAFMCCPSWLPKSIGNLAQSSLEDVWNGAAARSIRRSILDGSFRHCAPVCPFLQTKTGFVQYADEVVDQEMQRVVRDGPEVLPHGPRVVGAAFDWSCNLSCPTCRSRHIIEREAEDEIIALQEKLTAETFKDLRMLYITGSGDAFGSPYFLSWLRRMRLAEFAEMRIHLHTNAQLWTPRIWQKIPADVRERVASAEISIDAARETTYLQNRRGGDWQRLLDNLAFISTLRSAGPLSWVKIHMVVQENNFEEMPQFVELGKRFGFDAVYFSRLLDWEVLSKAEIEARSVHKAGHPRHAEFLRVLKDPMLSDPIVLLGNLSEFVDGHESEPVARHAAPDPVMGPYTGPWA